MNRRKDLPLQQPLNIGGKHIHANKRASPFRSFLPVDTTYGEELRELACHLAAFPYLSLYGKHTQENRKRTLHSPSSYSPSILYENWRQEILHLRQKLFCWILISLLQGFQKGWHPAKYKPFLNFLFKTKTSEEQDAQRNSVCIFCQRT